MVKSVQDHIRSLNFGYTVQLRDKRVDYINALGTFINDHTVSLMNPEKKTNRNVTARRILIAVGGRPTLLSCEGGEHAITSDDVFSLKESPKKTLVVGASYIALECAGFLAGLGLDVTVMVCFCSSFFFLIHNYIIECFVQCLFNVCSMFVTDSIEN